MTAELDFQVGLEGSSNRPRTQGERKKRWAASIGSTDRARVRLAVWDGVLRQRINIRRERHGIDWYWGER